MTEADAEAEEQRIMGREAGDPARAPRVMHVITGLGRGGAEGVLRRLIEAEAAVAEPLPVVSLTPGGINRDLIEASGRTVIDLGMARRKPSPLGVLRLTKLIRRHQPTVLQTWMYHADLIGTAAWLMASRWRSTALVWGIRSSDMIDRDTSPGLRRLIRACALLSRLPVAVVANSEAGRQVHRAYGYRPRRFEVIHNGIDLETFGPRPMAKSILTELAGLGGRETIAVHIARVAPKKDHDTLIAAARALDDVNVCVVAIGDGTDSLPRSTSLVGLGPRDDIAQLIGGADFALSCSAYGEGFSNAIGEAMAAGLPVVATDVGDAALLVGNTGIIIPPRNPSALAAAIREMALMPPARREELGRKARCRIVQNYSMTKMIEAFDQLYRTIDYRGDA